MPYDAKTRQVYSYWSPTPKCQQDGCLHCDACDMPKYDHELQTITLRDADYSMHSPAPAEYATVCADCARSNDP